MSTEADDRRIERRTFTEVASLFQPIIPPPGTAVRAPAAVVPIAVPEPAPAVPPETPPPPPPAETRPAAPAPAPVSADGPEAAWGGAWEPQPNWQPRRSWTWVLFLPLGVLAAGLIWVMNPAEMRRWIGEHVWKPDGRSAAPPPAVVAARPAPTPPAPVPEAAPPPTQPTPAAASPVAPGADQPLPPLLPPLLPFPTPGAPAAAPEPASPTVQPQAAAEPAPAEPPIAAEPARPVPPSYGPVVIRYRRGAAGEAEAAQLASRLRPAAERVEIRTAPSSYRVPTVLYFREEDRPAALSLAQAIGEPSRPLPVRLGQVRGKPGSLEIWLP